MAIGSVRGSPSAVSEPDAGVVADRGGTGALSSCALTPLRAGALTPECLVADLDLLRVAIPAGAVLRACPTEGLSDPAAGASADAAADPLKAAAPIPSATAKPPTRPMKLLATMVPPRMMPENRLR